MTTTTTIRVDSSGTHLGDRYERLRSGAEQIASDPNVAAPDSISGTDGVRAFVGDLIEARVLDRLSECDANTVSLLVMLDFTQGPDRIAWRIHQWLNGHTLSREDEVNPIGVCAALATALKILLDGLTPLNEHPACIHCGESLCGRPARQGRQPGSSELPTSCGRHRVGRERRTTMSRKKGMVRIHHHRRARPSAQGLRGHAHRNTYV
jgi:hypothetical protein